MVTAPPLNSPQLEPPPLVVYDAKQQATVLVPSTASAPVSQGKPNLRPCPDCGKEVSVNAAFCPHCGARPQKPKPRVLRTFVWTLVLLFCFFMLVGSLGRSGARQRPLTVDQPGVNATPAQLMRAAESAMRAGQFQQGANVLNRIRAEHPNSSEADVVGRLCAILREGEQQSNPFTVDEAQRTRKLMVSTDTMLKGYPTAPRDKQESLRVILGGAELLGRAVPVELETVVLVTEAIGRARDRALGR